MYNRMIYNITYCKSGIVIVSFSGEFETYHRRNGHSYLFDEIVVDIPEAELILPKLYIATDYTDKSGVYYYYIPFSLLERVDPILKFNGGDGVILCNDCSTIIKCGLTKDEFEGKTDLLFCEQCKEKK